MGSPHHTLASLLPVLVLALLLGAPTWADVVHLTNGSRISGEIVSESEKQVVVKTPQGKVTLPRRLVDRIERLSGDATLLELAKERLRMGAREAGIELLERAAKSKDKSVARRAKAQLRTLEAKARASKRRTGPRTKFPIPADVTGTPSEGATLQIQFDRLRLALDRRDGPRALALLASLRRDNPKHALLDYLQGRAHELAGDEGAARTAFLASLGGDARRVEKRELGWIKDLARRASAGEVLDSKKTPGAGSRWYRVAGEHAALYSLHELDVRLAARFDDLADRARDVFDLRVRESDIDGRIQIGLCVDRRELRRLAKVPLRTVVADGVLWRQNCLARDLKLIAPGLVARAILERAAPGTPEWAALGAAQRLQSGEVRRTERALALQVYGQDPPTLRAILDGATDPAKDPDAWRGLLGIVVDLLQTKRQTLRRALAFTSKIQRLGGAQKALERFRIDVEEIEGEFRDLLR
jgi:hypothetical protein